MPRAMRPAESPLPKGPDELNGPTFWDIDDIQFHCRVGRTSAWRLVREEHFPAPIVVGPKTLVWPRSEVVAFMESRRRPEHYSASVEREQPKSSNPEPVYRRRRVATRTQRS